MKTNTPSPVEEKSTNVPNIKRKTIVLGENAEEKSKKKNHLIPFLFIFLIIGGIGFILHKHVAWDLVRNTPTIQEKPGFFKNLQSKHYFKSVIPSTPVPAPTVEEEQKKEPEITISKKSNKIEIKSAKKQKISYEVPGYHEYDDIILNETKKYKGVKPVVIKAIIEQESYYNPNRIRYEEKWEKDYGNSIKKKRSENTEEWKMNFHSFGLMQIGYALHKDFCNLRSYTDLYNPSKNIECGTKLYASCIEAGNSDTYCIKRYNGLGSTTENYKNEVLGRIARLMTVNNKLSS